MKKTSIVAMGVVTLIVFFAAITLTGCEKDENDFVRDRVGATQHTTTITDTLTIHDTTVVVRDSIVHDTVTEVREVVVPVHDTITVPGESHEYTLRLRQWHNRWLGVSGEYLIGEDSVVLSKYEGATLLQTWRGTARHRGTATLSVGTTPYPTSVVGDSCFIAAMGGGVYSGNMAGHNVVMTLGPQAIQGPVVLNGQDWTAYLVAHEAIGQRVRFDADGNARGFIIDADGRAAGVVTAPYTTIDTTDTTTRRLVSVDTVYTHLSTTPNGVWNTTAQTLTWSCNNRRTITRHYNMAPLTETDQLNFTIGFPYTVSVSGSAIAAMLGSTVTISGGVATFTSGTNTLTVTLTAQPRTCTLNPIPLPCQHQLTTATVVSNGNGGYRVQVNGTLEGTSTTGYVPVTATPRTETSRDTAWNGCGSVTNTVRNGASHTINHTIVRTGTETIHFNIAPLTETHTVSETTHYVSSYTVSGSALTTAQGNTANFSGNSLTIGGATLTITPGAQPWCTLTYNSATLTSNGFVVSFTYNGSNGTVTIPVTWQTPDPIFTSVLAAAATDSYTHQIFSQSSYRHTFVCVVAQIGTNYRFYWAELAPNLVRADFDSVSITSTEANFYVNHLSDGYYPAMVYDHNNHTSLYRGVVTSVELGTGWQQTYRLAPSNSLAYVMGGSSWTMAGDTGRNAVRGVMNSSGQILADGITVQLY